MKLKSLLIIALVSLNAFAEPALVKPSVDDTTESAGAPLSSGDASNDKVAKVPTAGDDQKNQRILNALAAQSGWFPKLKIQVSNGMVTIEGEAKDSDQLAWLAKTADRLPTVIAVINKATVAQPPVTDLTPAWNEFRSLMNGFKRSLPLLLLAVTLFALFYFVSRYVYLMFHAIWGRHITNPFLLETVTKITMIPVWLMGFYLVLQTAGLSSLAMTILGGTGAVGIAVGFAFKDIAENYIAGLLLAIKSPFTKGDDVTVAGFDGYIQALNMRGTTILSYDGTMMLIPNSIVIQQVIKNRSTNPKSRYAFNIGIAYTDSTPEAIEVATQALLSIPAILRDPAPLVVATDLTPSQITLNVMFWIDTTKSSSYKSKSSAIASVKGSLLAHGFTIPDPGREVIFTEPVQIKELEPSVDVREATLERAEELKVKALETLQTARSQAVNTDNDHAEQIKRLGEGVDMMESRADSTLIKDGSV